MPPVRLARRALLALSVVFSLCALDSTRARARPPHFVPSDTFRPFVIEPVRAGAAPTSIPPSLRAALKRFGGSRALRVAQGVPAGKYVALRPMFWITRDHSGAMFALGGLF